MRKSVLLVACFTTLSLLLGGCASSLTGDSYSRDEARRVQVMMGLYVVMTALFIRIQALKFPELRTAVAAEDWPAGAAALGQIRKLVGINLIVGLLLVAIASARPMF